MRHPTIPEFTMRVEVIFYNDEKFTIQEDGVVFIINFTDVGGFREIFLLDK